MKKQVKILRGPSGAGKSTWTRQLADKLGVQVMVCSADHFFERRNEGLLKRDGVDYGTDYNFDPTKLPEAHAQCFNSFLRALANGDPVIVVDNTNERRWEYMNYELAAKIAGYEVEIVEFVVRTVEEIVACAKRNSHGVPLSVIATKAASMEPDTRATKVPMRGVGV